MKFLRRFDTVLLLILFVGLIVRVYMAVHREYVHDEDNTAIPIAETISLDPRNLHLPLRGENHPALPAYVVKASSLLFGTSRLGYRLMHVLLGLAIVAVVFRLTREWYGSFPARWAAALLAFNEYYLNVSTRATAHVPTLLLVTGAVYAFSRFLATDRAIYLYGAAASTGLAFYCKESTGLLLPVFFLALLFTRHRRSLLRPHVYLAVALYALMISPDVMWNLNSDPATVTVTYNDETHAQATYLAHLRRVGGLGFSPYPSMFYFRGTIQSLYARVTGNTLVDATPEYWSVNAVIGMLLVGAVLFTTFGPVKRESLRIFLLLMFWGIFTFFTLIKKGDPPGRLDPVSWMWVEITILPAIVMAGSRLDDLTGTWRRAVWTVTSLALLIACVRLVLSKY